MKVKELEKEIEELRADAKKAAELSERLAISEGAAKTAAAQSELMESALTELKEENKRLEENAKKYDELLVRYSQMENENAALKSGSEAARENENTISYLRKQVDSLSGEILTLQKTNSSLEKQISEILEDGQLTL